MSSSCIGLLEPHIHKVFAQERVPGEDFVYKQSNEMFNILEDFCDDQTIHEPRPPLLILGDSGSGKSALLANWLQRRQRNMTRSRAAEDFVFWHAVGCTRQSMGINNLMRRLMSDLKSRFELSRDVPLTQSRLSWDLPRFLELASKKGKAIIVLDGLHRLESSEGETNLSWLPLEFPPNIRIVLSATNMTNSSETNSKRNHVIAELERRNLQILHVKPLDRPTCRAVVDSFIKKTVQAESSSMAGGAFLTDKAADIPDASRSDIAGFLLFESQIRDIVTHRLASNPLFLRLLMRCLHWSVTRGFSLWHLMEDWLTSDSIESLYGAILSSFERGFVESPEATETARNLSVAAGSLCALKTLYSWHPSFQKLDEQGSTDMLAIDFQYGSVDSRAAAGQKVGGSVRHNSVTGGSMGMTSAGGQQWMIASQQAEAKLEGARVDTQRSMDAMVKRAKRLAEEEHIKYVEAFLRIQQEMLDSQMDDDESATLDDETGSNASLSIHDNEDDASLEDKAKTILENETEDNDSDTETFLTEPTAIEMVTEPTPKSDIQFLAESFSDCAVANALNSLRCVGEKDLARSNLELFNASLQGGPPIPATKKSRAASVFVSTKKEITKKQHSLPATGALLEVDVGQDDKDRTSPRPGEVEGITSKPRQVLTVENLEEPSTGSNKSGGNPYADLDKLPPFMLGGNDTAGFAHILGNALALLYVARHGLKESELWAMLSTIPKPGASNEQNAGRGKVPFTDEMKALVNVCYHYRERFREVWKSSDTMRTGRLTPRKLLVGMQTVNPEFIQKDLDMLLVMLDCKPSQRSSSVSSVGNNKTVDYSVLIERIVRAERVSKMDDIRIKKSKEAGEDVSVNDLEDPMFNSVPLGEEIDGYFFDDFSATDTQNGSLGPVMEEGLLSALCALGVLHSPKDQVIVLPCENEQLRHVILERYILAKRGSEEEWHLRIIRFFQRKQNSLRRCEELPWHLKICRRWFSLRSVLADLKTFNIMSQGELRDELLSYWHNLIKCPLYVTDKAEAEANNASRMQISDSQRILSELDSASALHLTEKEIKKHLLKDCVANFDIVEELDKSVGLWIDEARPNGATISQTLLHISKFIAEYCRMYEVSPAPFLRLGMEKRFFTMFNVPLEVKSSTTESLPQGAGGDFVADGPGKADKGKKIPVSGNDDDVLFRVVAKPTAVGNNVVNLSKQDAHLYLYYRWMWIQFPWLAMPSCSKHLASLLEASASKSKDGLAHTNHHMDKLLAASSIHRSNILGDASTASAGAVSIEDSMKDDVPLSPTMDANELRRREVAGRSWKAKKLDPAKGRVVSTSAARTAAVIKSSLTSVKSLDAIENFSKTTLGLTHTMPGTSVGPSPHQAVDKYRYPLDVHVKSVSKIPHSQPSNRSLRHQTLFPSVAENFKEQQIKAKAAKDPHSVMAAKRFGGLMDEDEDRKASFHDEITRIHINERLKELNARSGSCIPQSSVEGVVADLELEKTGRLRKAFDKVRELRRQKELQLHDMQSSADNREDIDGEVLAAIESADFTMNSLQDRFVALQSALTEAKQLNVGYSKLVSFLQVNQPSTETHMESLEQEVRLARQQVEDLKAYRVSLYEETDRIEKEHIKSLKEKVQNIKSQRSINLKRIKEQKAVMAITEQQLHDANRELHGKAVRSLAATIRRTVSKPPAQFAAADLKRMQSTPDIVEEVVSRKMQHQARESGAKSRFSMANIVDRSIREPSLLDMTPQQNLAPRELSPEQRKNVVDHVVSKKVTMKQDFFGAGNLGSEASGISADSANETKAFLDQLFMHSATSNVDDFLETFKNSQRLYESMKSHQSLAESRLSQLRGEYNELYASLGETVFISTVEDESAEKTTSTNAEREMRYLDQRLFKAEMRLNHNMRQTEKSVLSINEIRTGVVHIASLLSANDELLQNLPQSTPPVMKSDAGIAKMLAWCEERVLAINEALVLDASKPAGIDDTKPLHARQTELASLIQGMIHRDESSAVKAQKRKLRNMKKDNMSKTLLAIPEGANSHEYGVGAAVRVVADCDTEKLYAEQVDEVMAASNAHAELIEKAENAIVSEDPTKATLRLVTDAIKSQESSTALRRANKLANRKQGRRAGFGWTVEEMLRNSVEEEAHGSHGSGDRRKKKQGGSQSAITRQEMKQLSQSRVHYLHDVAEKGDGGSGVIDEGGAAPPSGGKE